MSNTSRHAVALGTPGETDANTIVLGGATVVIPLEMDPDHDPLHDDEVRLWSAHGGYDRTMFVSDPNVEADIDARLMFYRFEDVPRGVYRVAVCVAGEWHDLMHNLIVTMPGVFLGGQKLESEKPALRAAPQPEPRAFDQAASTEDENE